MAQTQTDYKTHLHTDVKCIERLTFTLIIRTRSSSRAHHNASFSKVNLHPPEKTMIFIVSITNTIVKSDVHQWNITNLFYVMCLVLIPKINNH